MKVEKTKAISIRFEVPVHEKIMKVDGADFSKKLHNVLNEFYSDERKLYLESLDDKIADKIKILKTIQKEVDKIQKIIRDVSWKL